ncbi:MAG: O-antigen ligase family protein [Candidatus Helarchaeota archaeon]|nr:O-antigen ligase family protein [Candidatus Helarchaeota archaeon]
MVIFLIPFSIEIFIPQFFFATQFPTEPLILGVILVWILRTLLNRDITFAQSSFNKPIIVFFSICILSLIKSEYLLYSIKGSITLLLYILIGYFFTLNNIKNKEDIKKVTLLLIFLSLIFSGIGIYNHFFTKGLLFQSITKGVPRPFFSEHGSYAAFITFGFALSLNLGLNAKNNLPTWIFRIVSLIIFAGIILSFTRAAWLGTLFLIVFSFWFTLLKKFSVKNIFILFLIILIFCLIIYLLVLNTDVLTHFFSIYDIRNLSNLERLNRWTAAVRMFEQNPVLGVGYDTYINNYYYYRNVNYLTPLSSSFMGVHSEFLKVLSETGIVGLVSFILLLFIFFREGFKVYNKMNDLFLKLTILGIIGGFSSYLIQGIFNNFTKIDKVAVPFWLSFGLIAAIGRLIQENKINGKEQ